MCQGVIIADRNDPGHKELTTTQRYAHLSETSLADVMERLSLTSEHNMGTTGNSAESESVVNPHKH